MVVATLWNLWVSVIHLYSGNPVLTSIASALFRLGLPVFLAGCENPYRLLNGSTGCRESIPRPSLVCKRLGSGNRLGVLATPSSVEQVHFVIAQDVEKEIKYRRYLIGAIGQGATRLRQDHKEPLPVPQLIFLNRDDDIRAGFLVNNGHDPLDLMVLESRPEERHDLDDTCEPPNARRSLFYREVWDDSACAEYAAWEMQEKEEWIDDNE